MNSTPALSPSAIRKARIILAFCGLYLAVQLSAIVACQFSASKHFGFWMFPESTYFRAKLSRVLADGQEVKARNGVWTVNREAKPVRYKWNSFVKGYRLDLLEQKVRSKGTFADTMKYMQGAVDYVAARIPEDKSTDQVVLTVRYHRAGGPEQKFVLKSRPRLGGAHHNGSQ